MDQDHLKNVKFKEAKEGDSPHVEEPSIPYRRAFHPFLCRLKETANFTVTAPNALVAAGFASMGMGFFTLFRPTPVLLFLLVTHLKRNDLLPTSARVFIFTAVFWEAALLFVLIVLGFVLTFSVRIKKRSALLLHPWGLMILYFDAVVWLTLTLLLHLGILSEDSLETAFTQIQTPIVYFIVIYVDNTFFFFLHYVYATYFITAELSVIERCY